MARYNNNSRVTPDAVQDYNLQPAASVVDKQSKYTPQVGDTQKLKQLAIGLSDLAKGATAVNTLMARQASEYNIKKYAETDEENRKTFADYSKNIEGFAKFNPFNIVISSTLISLNILATFKGCSTKSSPLLRFLPLCLSKAYW